ncbi:hypothetical protein L1987_75154 [Smallanthus sonchifolius]|uniref:Uncharacterized protein n=1 Tax=Smallanthus sonchifolius TaxID=185202 RepID=A0ACB9A5P5_9ASTR|nr:hypothetical protein L1987_75154 [Smallanthus sonchifolius]
MDYFDNLCKSMYCVKAFIFADILFAKHALKPLLYYVQERKRGKTYLNLIHQDSNRGETGELMVKRLRASRALTVPETTTTYEACCRMAAKRVLALFLTDSNALLWFVTDKDVATSVIAHEIDFMNTPASKVITKNLIYVLSDTLVVEALQKMVQGL